MAIWLQGCTLGCPGCFNPETHSRETRDQLSFDQVFERILPAQNEIEGITISGGEPLQQRKPLLGLLQRTRRETSLSVVVFTGYEDTEIKMMPDIEALLSCVDVLIAGRYVDNLRTARGLCGSANKTIHLLSERYRMADLEAIPEAEVVLTPEGDVLTSGIDPLRIKGVSR